MSSNPLQNDPVAVSEFEVFIGLLDRYAEVLAANGKKHYRSPLEAARKLFLARDPAHRRISIERLRTDLALFDELRAAGESPGDTVRFLWRFLARSRLAPTGDLFDKIVDTDVINVYGPDQTMVFQSLNFFDWVSVTLEQVFCEAWHVLSRRDPAIAQQIYEAGVQLFSGGIRETWNPGLPWHLIEEVESELQLSFDLRLKYLAPLYQAGQIAGAVAVNECRVADPERPGFQAGR